MDNSSFNIIQYVPFNSFVHPSFWHTLTELKLTVDKLNESSKKVYGRFTYRDDIGAIFEVDGTSYNQSPHTEMLYENVCGTVMNKNTIEEFKNLDKASLLNSIGEIIWEDIKRKSWIINPASLLNFLILSFADLKKFHYYYWFAFPSPSQPTLCMKSCDSILDHFDETQLLKIVDQHKNLSAKDKPYFIIHKACETTILPLSSVISQDKYEADFSEMYFGFLDPSDGVNPGWPLRVFLAALIEHFHSLGNSELKVLGLRFSPDRSINKSKVFTIFVPEDLKSSESAGWVGWERNDKGNFGPRLANMSASMDPIRLADNSADLNIKLMKWRLAPDLNTDIMKDTKCLLLGAGTLGCHVARDLLAWGFRHITFVDNGKVSYSNPTRQVLYNFDDCLNNGRRKAHAAAENLKRVLPTVITEGIDLHIPMPGHPVGESLKTETINSINKLHEAISSHDVIFLLLDTREARWLPTLLGSYFKKIVINAALGFDSYLVIRHGVHSDDAIETSLENTVVPGGHLGCYFCNDVTAPGNSLKDRTLDQQCTVTRPGVAAIAGAIAVEMLVGLLQHPLKHEAPAAYNINQDNLPDNLEGILGPIPHSIRGFIHSYTSVTPTCVKFKQCIACSDVVINTYKENGMDFLMKAFESGKYLEDVTGLSQLHLAAEMSDVLTLSDEDEED